jgi:hypothetical protein
MAKKESLNKDKLNFEGADSSVRDSAGGAKGGAGASKAFGIVKFILGVCLLPFVYSSTLSFLREFALAGGAWQRYFWWGVGGLLLVHLFIWEPAKVYTAGFKLVELLFIFFKPFVHVAPYLLPVYTLVILVLYGIFSSFIKEPWLMRGALFSLGFTLTLHLIFSARSLRGKKGDFLKGNYIFGFSFVYLLNLVLLVFCFNVVFEKFSVFYFTVHSYHIAGDIFYSIFKQLFLR